MTADTDDGGNSEKCCAWLHGGRRRFALRGRMQRILSRPNADFIVAVTTNFMLAFVNFTIYLELRRGD